MSTVDSQLQMFKGYRCQAAELAITGSLPMAGLASLTIGTEVEFVIEVGDQRYPISGSVAPTED